MRRNQYQDAVLRELGAVHTHAFVAGHRLGGMRRYLREVAAEPPLTGGIFALPAVLVLLSLTALVVLLA
ncbi:MAG: hypothetical protein H6R00_386 [Proteobacteria bacterium]|nr:hypothetical protein [Pseudomonadota bacterium]